MANKKKKSPHGKQKGKKVAPVIEEQDLERFAGSSDEEEEEHNDKDHVTNNKKQPSKPRKEPRVIVEHDADEESGNEDDDDDDDDDDAVKVTNKALSKKKRKQHQRKDDDDDDDDSNMDEEPTIMVTNKESMVDEDVEPAEKMADVMAKILGTSLATRTKASSVVLAKTVTPLQRLQQQEKEKEKALKQKRQANRERNLAALHIPLSVATTNSVGEGRVSITKELEQERFHRRVATRGVVALFNAIAQHQNATENDEETAKKSDSTKLTKHSFLDKIKSTAATIAGNATSVEEKLKMDVKGEGSKSAGKWDALKDDFMMNPKKNWDEESSEDEENSDQEQPEDPVEKEDVEEPKKNKRRKVSARA